MKTSVSSRWWIAASLWATAAGSAAGASYLAEEGPPPLRFAMMRTAAVEKRVLPPLALTTPAESTPSGTAESATAEALGSAETTDPGASVPAPVPGTGAGLGAGSEPIVIPPAAMMPPTIVPGMSVTPQMLLGYFGTGGTNGVSPVVLAPVSFVPPQSGSAGSSRATYRQVP